MTHEPAHIVRAKQLIAAATASGEYSGEVPTGITTLRDLQQAETALARAQNALREYQSGDDGMREALSPDGIKSAVVERHRSEQLEYYQDRVHRARLRLQQVKREFLRDLED